MNDIWLFLIGIIALPYILVPILIRRNHYFARHPKLRTVLTGFLPKPVENFFDSTTSEIAKIGFEPRIDAVSHDFGPNFKVFMRLFVEKKKAIIAIASSLVPDGKVEPTRNFIEFGSRFVDGHELSTHNSDLIGAPIEHSQKIIVVLPKVNNVHILLSMHEHTLNKVGFANKSASIPNEGVELDYLVQGFHNELSNQAKLGCLELDDSTEYYRPTWAGAFLIGWYSMWPIGPAMRLWRRLKAKLTLRALLTPVNN